MNFLQRNAKRILTDAAGYLLILGGILLSPVPGPGGIPLIIAGLGILSINNIWAQRLRDQILQHGGKLVTFLFPKNPYISLFYDVLTLALLALVTILAAKHAAIWQLSVAIVLFFLALFIASMNRDRLSRVKRRLKKKS